MADDMLAPIDLVAEIAAALRDVVESVPDEALDQDAERIYTGMALKLIVRLAPQAAIIPRAAIGAPLVNGARQMAAVSAELTHVIGLYKREGYDAEAINLALTDAHMKFVKRRYGTLDTTEALRRMVVDINELIRDESAEEGVH